MSFVLPTAQQYSIARPRGITLTGTHTKQQKTPKIQNATLGVLAPGRTVSRYIGLPGLMSRTMHQAKAEPTSDTGLLCTHLQLTTYLQDFQYSSNLTEEHHSHANLPCADSRPWSFCLVVCRVLGKRVYRSKRVTGPMLRIG